jgi:hypothetical protein
MSVLCWGALVAGTYEPGVINSQEEAAEKSGQTKAAPSQAEIAALKEGLVAALESGDMDKISAATRLANERVGYDPDLDWRIGDVLVNKLLWVKEGGPLIKDNPQPDNPEWRRAARDAAVRLGDLEWLDELLVADGVHREFNDLNIIEQIVRRAQRDLTVNAETFLSVTEACGLVSARPQLGRRRVDLHVSRELTRAVELLGATRVVIARTVLVRSPSSRNQVWQCENGWISADEPSILPEELPPKGVLFVATDGASTGYIEIDETPEGTMALASRQSEMVARWIAFGEELHEQLAQPGAVPAEIEAALLQKYGPGLALPTEEEK